MLSSRNNKLRALTQGRSAWLADDLEIQMTKANIRDIGGRECGQLEVQCDGGH